MYMELIIMILLGTVMIMLLRETIILNERLRQADNAFKDLAKRHRTLRFDNYDLKDAYQRLDVCYKNLQEEFKKLQKKETKIN